MMFMKLSSNTVDYKCQKVFCKEVEHDRPSDLDDHTQPTYEMTLGSNFHKTYFDSLFRNTFSVPFISPLGYKPLRL